MIDPFELITAVEPLGDGHYRAEIAEGWDIGGNTNGGFVLAICGRAMVREVGRPPATITAHYLAPARSGPCAIDVTVVRSGRRFATARASVMQGDRQILEVLGTFGALDDRGVTLIDGSPPELPEFDDAAMELSAAEWEASPPFHHRVDIRLRPEDVGFRTDVKLGRAEFAGWFGFHDGSPIDEIGLLLVADAFPPPIFNLDVPVVWVPTLELTVHIRAVPKPGPLRCRFATEFIGGGRLNEDGTIWDSAGNLVAQSRQLALVPRGD